jgi:von Willebrand factor type A domain
MRLWWCLLVIAGGCYVLSLTSCVGGVDPSGGTHKSGSSSGSTNGNASTNGSTSTNGSSGNASGSGSAGGEFSGGSGGDDGGYVPPACGMDTFAISFNQSAPNVLLVLDQSGSMQDAIPGTTSTKWDTAKTAIFALLTAYQGKVRWGLAVFPSLAAGAGACDPGQLEVPFGDDRTAAITNLLTPITSDKIGGSTPTESTLQNMQMTGGLSDATRNNYILLLTDGLPTCGEDGKVTPVVAALYAQTPSVRTYVIGLGADTDSNPMQLDDWADAGHTARPSPAPHKYYQANNVSDLQSAFTEIASGVVSCTFQLTMAPPDPSLLVADFDGTAVPGDATNGMTYDAATQSVTFHGTSCDSLKSGSVKKVDLVYGCPAPPVS